MNRETFLKEISRIFETALIQKAIKMVLRAAWVGGAVYLLCWGVNRLWGWLPVQSMWFMIAGSVSITILGSAFMVRKPTKKFVWRLDRGYQLEEQVYTAYEYIEDHSGNVESQPGFKELIKSDLVGRLPEVRRKVVDTGWQIREEFESTLVVLILLLIVYLLSVGDISSVPPQDNFGILPSLGKDPTASELLSGEIPGDGLQRDTSVLSPESGEGTTPSICEGNWDQVVGVFNNLGEDLSQGAATFVIGQNLKQQDFSQAATGFSSLAEDVNGLTHETKNELANVMLDAAVSFQEIGRQDMSAFFQNASAALFEGRNSVISQQMDELAALMEVCENCPRIPVNQGFKATSTETLEISTPPGEVVDLSAFSSTPMDIGSGNIGIEQGFGINLGENVPGYLLPFPYDLNLDDSDVVSSYFSPR